MGLADRISPLVLTGGLERAYAEGLSPALIHLVAAVSGRVPFGLAEPAMVAGALWVAWPAARGVARAARAGRLRPAARAAVGGIGRAALHAAVLAGWFYAAWGFNYHARTPLAERLGWAPLTAASDGAAVSTRDADPELRALATAYVAHANDAYRAVHGQTDAGRATQLADALAGSAVLASSPGATRPLADAVADGPAGWTGASMASASHDAPDAPDAAAWRAIDVALDEGLRAAAAELGEGTAFGETRGPAKPVRASAAMSRMHLAGFFFPWTGEANVNAQMPAFQLPQSMAHEKAHQRGIASEDEANFAGFLAAIRSPLPLARYSGLLFAQRQLLGELCGRDEAACTALLAERLPGVQRDVDDARAFWARHDGPAAEAHERVNDAYLTAHGVEGGVDSYAASVQLILAWARAGGVVGR